MKPSFVGHRYLKMILKAEQEFLNRIMHQTTNRSPYQVASFALCADGELLFEQLKKLL